VLASYDPCSILKCVLTKKSASPPGMKYWGCFLIFDTPLEEGLDCGDADISKYDGWWDDVDGG
jgi:hypothetical protein